MDRGQSPGPYFHLYPNLIDFHISIIYFLSSPFNYLSKLNYFTNFFQFMIKFKSLEPRSLLRITLLALKLQPSLFFCHSPIIYSILLLFLIFLTIHLLSCLHLYKCSITLVYYLLFLYLCLCCIYLFLPNLYFISHFLLYFILNFLTITNNSIVYYLLNYYKNSLFLLLFLYYSLNSL